MMILYNKRPPWMNFYYFHLVNELNDEDVYNCRILIVEVLYKLKVEYFCL